MSTEASRYAPDSNLWILTPDELGQLSDDTQLESTGGTKKILAELRDPNGLLREQTDSWGVRSDTEPHPQRKLEQ